MERSGPGLALKIAIAAVAGLVVQDVIVVALWSRRAETAELALALAAVLALTLVLAAVWGGSLAHALRQLARSCYVARKGDTHVLVQMPRADEIGQVNEEINRLVVLVRDLTEVQTGLSASAAVADAVNQSAPDLLRTSQDALVSLKELREGASAGGMILSRVAGRVEQARRVMEQVARPLGVRGAPEEIALRLKALERLSHEVELLADQVVDEVARPSIDEAALAREVNGLRDAARTMAEVAGHALPYLERRRLDAEAAEQAVEGLTVAGVEAQDGVRVGELMERSAASGMSAATRLASSLRRIGVVLEVYADRRRLGLPGPA
jgi:HAMP domain-containing protein